MAAEERGGGPWSLHRHGGPACSLRCCQGRPAVSATATGAQPKVRDRQQKFIYPALNIESATLLIGHKVMSKQNNMTTDLLDSNTECLEKYVP